MVVGCQPDAPAAFTPTKYTRYSFLLEAESTPGPQCDQKDFMSMKNPLTPAGIESATFRIVAQHLNHRATAVPAHLLYIVYTGSILCLTTISHHFLFACLLSSHSPFSRLLSCKAEQQHKVTHDSCHLQ